MKRLLAQHAGKVKSLELALRETQRLADRRASEGTKKMILVASARAEAANAQERRKELEKEVRSTRRLLAEAKEELLHWGWFTAKCDKKTSEWVSRLKRTPPRRFGYCFQ